jgi:hypothetical protein
VTIEGTTPTFPEAAVTARPIRPTNVRPTNVPVKVLAAVLLGLLTGLPLAGCSAAGEKRAGWTPILPPAAAVPGAAPAPNGLEQADAGGVYARVHRAFSDSPSVHATGELVSSEDTVLIDVHLETDRAQGTFVSAGLGRISEIVIGPTVYLSGDQAFLRTVGGEALARRGRDGAWISGPTGRAGLVELPLLARADYLALLAAPRLYPLGDGFTAGVPTRTFTDDGGLRLEVPLAGEPRPLRVWKRDAAGHLDLHFEYGPGWAVHPPGVAAPV